MAVYQIQVHMGTLRLHGLVPMLTPNPTMISRPGSFGKLNCAAHARLRCITPVCKVRVDSCQRCDEFELCVQDRGGRNMYGTRFFSAAHNGNFSDEPILSGFRARKLDLADHIGHATEGVLGQGGGIEGA